MLIREGYVVRFGKRVIVACLRLPLSLLVAATVVFVQSLLHSLTSEHMGTSGTSLLLEDPVTAFACVIVSLLWFLRYRWHRGCRAHRRCGWRLLLRQSWTSRAVEWRELWHRGALPVGRSFVKTTSLSVGCVRGCDGPRKASFVRWPKRTDESHRRGAKSVGHIVDDQYLIFLSELYVGIARISLVSHRPIVRFWSFGWDLPLIFKIATSVRAWLDGVAAAYNPGYRKLRGSADGWWMLNECLTCHDRLRWRFGDCACRYQRRFLLHERFGHTCASCLDVWHSVNFRERCARDSVVGPAQRSRFGHEVLTFILHTSSTHDWLDMINLVGFELSLHGDQILETGQQLFVCGYVYVYLRDEIAPNGSFIITRLWSHLSQILSDLVII